MLPDFKLKKDWYITTNILGVKNRTLTLPEGHIITPTKNGEYHVMCGGWSENTPHIGCRIISDEEGMSNAVDEDGQLLFERIDHFDSELIIEEVPEDDDNQIKNWRIQLDVKTTRKKLKEIQRIFEDQIKPLVR